MKSVEVDADIFFKNCNVIHYLKKKKNMQEETQKFVRYCSFCKTDIVTVRYGAGCRARHVPITSNQKSAVCFDKKEIQKRSRRAESTGDVQKYSIISALMYSTEGLSS